MPARFLDLAPDRQALAFEQAGTQRGVHPGIVEKDFWVTWLLKILFSHCELGPHLVFKGGTCLSKVFGVIEFAASAFQRGVALHVRAARHHATAFVAIRLAT